MIRGESGFVCCSVRKSALHEAEGLTWVPSEKDPTDDVMASALAGTWDPSIPKMKYMKHQADGRITQNAGAADVGSCDDAVDILRDGVIWQNICLENSMQQNTGCPACTW